MTGRSRSRSATRDVASGGGGAAIGLALAGGGPEGAVYEIGALRGLDEALEGLDFNALHVYVGVSAGSFVASCLANGMTTTQLCRAIVKQEPGEHPFVPEYFFTPATGEWMRRGLLAPQLIWEALAAWLANPRDQSLFDAMGHLTRALPLGLFANEPIRHYLERIFSLQGRTDDFRELHTQLRIVAADLDSGTAVRFGEPGMDHVPISHAVQASTALPGLYPPVEIGGRHYVDGVLLKTLHASVALDAGAKLLICVNPIVPVDTEDSVAAGAMRHGKLINRGLPTVLSQTFRTMVHSRLTVGMDTYRQRFPDAEVVLFEPGRDDYRMFFTNIFRFSSRRAVCEHAYRSIRRQLLERRATLEPILARYGVTLRMDVLTDPKRTVWTEAGYPESDLAMTGNVTGELSETLARLERIVDRLDPGPATS